MVALPERVLLFGGGKFEFGVKMPRAFPVAAGLQQGGSSPQRGAGTMFFRKVWP